MSVETWVSVVGMVLVVLFASYVMFEVWRGPTKLESPRAVLDPWVDVLVTHAAVFDSLPQHVQDALRPEVAEARRLRQSLGVTYQQAAEGLALVRPVFLPSISGTSLLAPASSEMGAWISQEKVRS